MMPYREGGGAGFVCTRCGETTPPNPHVPADEGRVAAETFVCVECLLRMQEMASRGRESLWVKDPQLLRPRMVTASDLAVYGVAGVGLLALLTLVAQGHVFFLLMGLAVVGLGYAHTQSGRDARWLARVRWGSLTALAVGVSGQVIVRLTPARKPTVETVDDPVLRINLPNQHGRPGVSPDPVRARAEQAETTRREERAQVFGVYALGLEAGEATLPKGFPTVWRFAKAPAVSPFNAGIWITDDTLTDTHVLVESDRLRLGGTSTRQGKAVTCAGVVEPAGDEPAVFATSCADASGAAFYRVVRVHLPELASLLVNAPPSKGTLPVAQRGTFKATTTDCKAPGKKITFTASTIVEDDGLVLAAVTASPTGLGTVLGAINVPDARTCSGMLDRWDGHPRLSTDCLGRARRTICAP